MSSSYAVLFEDNEDRSGKRQEYMRDHLAFLEENADAIVEAGPLFREPDGAPAGGMWLVSAEGPEQVRALVEADPFWPTGLRKSYRILNWRKVFANGGRL